MPIPDVQKSQTLLAHFILCNGVPPSSFIAASSIGSVMLSASSSDGGSKGNFRAFSIPSCSVFLLHVKKKSENKNKPNDDDDCIREDCPG